jgi:dihydrodipicolinate synthase/N-acetylneuraminate lyase
MTTATAIELPGPNGPRVIELEPPARIEPATAPPASRIAYAAGHIVPDPLRSSAGSPLAIDWDATMRVRHMLWDLGLGVAESMDTAQRGMGLHAEGAMELAERTLREAAGRKARVVVGVTSDALEPGAHSLGRVADAYIEQLQRVEDAGGTSVVMASRQLARAAESPDDYLAVYGRVLAAASRPVILHWLGTMFDPSLAGYWGSPETADASETVLELISAHVDKVAGIKLSLLDRDHEVAFRRRLPQGVRLFTGDDFNYSELIAGDQHGHSDALLGAFAAVPRFASAALKRLDTGDAGGFREILDPTVPLSRLVFEAPTQFYKVGVAWLSFLNGWQDHFRMAGGIESGRPILHLAELFSTANGIGLFEDPELAAARASAYFRGVGF